uniref:Uncharacterized protein n=1 Tax=Salix viminalis TaxID=40686 RepID=A0A6N2JXQ0_SALVM
MGRTCGVSKSGPRNGGWPGGGGLGLVGVLPMRSQVRIRSGANNSLGPLDLGEALNLTWCTCGEHACRALVHPRR